MKQRTYICALVICASLIINTLYCQVRIVLSAALTDPYFDLRKDQYIKSFNILDQLGYKDFYIIEAVKKQGPTFLDNYSKNVFYSSMNNPKFRNHGINEAMTLYEGVCHFNFAPEDMIIKFTGRYHLLTDSFIKLVENNLDYDAIVRFDVGRNKSRICSGGFAMKCKYFKEMCEKMDCAKMENKLIILEVEMGNYLKSKQNAENFKVLYVDKIDIKADYHGSTWYTTIGKETLATHDL